MTFDGSMEVGGEVSWAIAEKVPRWQLVHGELASIARRRAALDAEEARWLREAEALRIWKPFGMVSMLDYLERVLGYAPRTGFERLRVARALGDLPELTEALAQGELPFSAIKELTRVATPRTEASWRHAARGQNLRQIEELVSGHRPGDTPDDPKDEQARLHDWTFRELSASTFALMRQARQILDDEHGTRMTDDQIVAALAATIVRGASASETTGRARNQIAYTVCECCKKAWQDGAGVQVPVDAATIEQALCDAQHIGSIDGNGPTKRASQDIPPAIVRFVWRRDKARCQTPGCRSKRCLEIHHIVPRSAGGTHDPSNLTLRCGACHTAHHTGMLTISGTAPDQIVTIRTRAPEVRVAPSNEAREAPRTDVVKRPAPALPVAAGAAPSANARWQAVVTRTEAISGLAGMGWNRSIAARAVDEAIRDLTTPTTAELIMAALRRCPKPLSS